MPEGTIGIGDCCSVVRTKNAGPFLITADLIFKSASVYRTVLAQGLLTKERIAAAYGLSTQEILVFETYDDVAAVKVVFPRRHPSGSPGDTDCYGMNQEVPLLSIRFPAQVAEREPA